MLLIKNGNIHTGNGPVKKSFDLLISGGKIKEIGSNLKYPRVKTIDAGGKEIFPGFIDPLSPFGCMDLSSSSGDENENSHPLTPEVKMKYSFNPHEIMLEKLFQTGITSAGAAPGNTNILGGQMAVFKSWGRNKNKMLIKEAAGLKGAVTDSVKKAYGEKERFPKTRMGIFKELKKALWTTREKIESKKELNSGEKTIQKVLNKEVPLFISANTSMEIHALLDIVSDFKLDLVICGAYQAHDCLPALKKARASLVLGEQFSLSQGLYNNTNLGKIYEELNDSCLISFTLSALNRPAGRLKYLWNAIEFFKHGIESEEILKFMTINPARMLQVDNRIGSIEEGKDADLVIFDNNPIQKYDARTLYTLVDGKIAYPEGKTDASN